MPAHVRVSGVWRKTLASVRVAGAWRSTPQIYAKAGGVWRALYSYAWSLGGWGGCSASCGGGVQYRTVTCARNDGVTVGDEVCLKLVGAKPATSQACNTQSCVSCRYDSNNYIISPDWGVSESSCTCARYPSTGAGNAAAYSTIINGKHHSGIPSPYYGGACQDRNTSWSCDDSDCNRVNYSCIILYQVCGPF